MTWTLDYNSRLHIVELVLAGRTTRLDLQESTSKTIALSKDRDKAGVLVDATKIELAASTVDLYDLPAHQYVAEDLDRRTSVAIVQPQSHKEQEAAQFYENACINRGWRVRLFPNRDEAIDWLTGAGSSDNPDAGDG